MIDLPHSARNDGPGWCAFFEARAAEIETEGELPAAVADVFRAVGQLEQDGVLEDVMSSLLDELIGHLHDAELAAAFGALLAVREAHAVGGQVKTAAVLDLVIDELRAEGETRGLEFDTPL